MLRGLEGTRKKKGREGETQECDWSGRDDGIQCKKSEGGGQKNIEKIKGEGRRVGSVGVGKAEGAGG